MRRFKQAFNANDDLHIKKNTREFHFLLKNVFHFFFVVNVRMCVFVYYFYCTVVC